VKANSRNSSQTIFARSYATANGASRPSREGTYFDGVTTNSQAESQGHRIVLFSYESLHLARYPGSHDGILRDLCGEARLNRRLVHEELLFGA
jgi:hypothetical protein